MNIKKIKRPWVIEQKPRKYEPFYHSSSWTKLRKAFMLGHTTLDNGKIVPHTLCIECYKEGRTTPANTVDHIHRIKDGGSATDMANLQSLCRRHHDIKSSKEGHETKMKMKSKKS